MCLDERFLIERGDLESLSKRLGYQTECRLPTRQVIAVFHDFVPVL